MSIKVILGTLAGISIGAIIGILYAPEKGSTTRRNLSDKSDETMKQLKSKYNEFTDSFSNKYENTKNEASNFVKKGQDKFEEIKKM